MPQSTDIAELAAALLKAQDSFPPISRGRTATISTKDGKSYSYSYADLGDIRDAILPVLSANGLVVTQSPAAWGDGPALTTTLLHISGQWISSTLPLPETSGAQALGSALTYARRYALSAIVGVVTESDDDGAAASHNGYELGGGNDDFDTILRGASASGMKFLVSLAEQIKSKGTLTDNQLSKGVRAAIDALEDTEEEPF